MDHFGSGIRDLPRIRKGDSEVIGSTVVSFEDRTWIQHRHSGSKISSDPFDRSISFDDGPLCIEIIGIDRPVLDG